MSTILGVIPSDDDPEPVTPDGLITAGVRHQLAPLGTSSRMFMTTRKAQAIYDQTIEALELLEHRLGRELTAARAEAHKVAASGYSGITDTLQDYGT